MITGGQDSTGWMIRGQPLFCRGYVIFFKTTNRIGIKV